MSLQSSLHKVKHALGPQLDGFSRLSFFLRNQGLDCGSFTDGNQIVLVEVFDLFGFKAKPHTKEPALPIEGRYKFAHIVNLAFLDIEPEVKGGQNACPLT